MDHQILPRCPWCGCHGRGFSTVRISVPEMESYHLFLKACKELQLDQRQCMFFIITSGESQIFFHYFGYVIFFILFLLILLKLVLRQMHNVIMWWWHQLMLVVVIVVGALMCLLLLFFCFCQCSSQIFFQDFFLFAATSVWGFVFLWCLVENPQNSWPGVIKVKN